MKREYKLIIYTYLALQLTTGLGIELTSAILQDFGFSEKEGYQQALSIWPVLSFSMALIATLLLLRNDYRQPADGKASIPISVFWAIGGVFLAIIAQNIAVRIESLFGVEMGSENTQQLVEVIKYAPLFILVTSIIGPILEEIVFRKIIFGTLHKRFNFWIAALVSSLIFSIAHLELEHTILYAAIGLTFAYLYTKTKRIIVPIMAHVLMNTLVVIAQLN